MKHTQTSRGRRLALLALTLPLLQTTTCLDIAQQSILRGFFNAVTPQLVAAAQDRLGVEPASGPVTPGTTLQP
jgi:hypothetical protein